MKHLQPIAYKRRLRNLSSLPAGPRLVAVTIADLRYEARLKWHEPLPLSTRDLARACGMKSETTATKHVDACIEAGWLAGRSVVANGRQQPNEYFLTDPTASDTDHTRVWSVIRAGGGRNVQILTTRVWAISPTRVGSVVRSNYKGGSDDAALCGGGGSDEQGQSKSARPTESEPPAVADPDARPRPRGDLQDARPEPRGLDPRVMTPEEPLSGEALRAQLIAGGLISDPAKAPPHVRRRLARQKRRRAG